MKKRGERMNILEIVGLLVAIVALVVSIWAVVISKNIAVTDRKANTYTDAIVYLEKMAFINESPNLGFGDAMITDVNDEWIKEQIIIAVDIKSRLNLHDESKAKDFWSIISGIYGKEHIFDQDKYQKLRKEIINELNK